MPFVTFEGVEGSGKSTQMRLAAARLGATGREVLETREPGGTAIGATLRGILMDTGNTHLDPVTEWLLLEADRRQHVLETLRMIRSMPSRDAIFGNSRANSVPTSRRWVSSSL